MKYDEVIILGRMAGLFIPRTGIPKNGALMRFANLVAEYERESCAELCNSLDETDIRYRYDYRRGVLDCADAIRSRSNT